MPTQDTPNLGFDYIEAAQAGKETTANANFDIADIGAGLLSKALVNGNNILTVNESRYGCIYLTGLLSASAQVTIDVTIFRRITIVNATTGGQTVQARFGAGTLRTIPAGDRIEIWPSGVVANVATLAGDVSGLSSAAVVGKIQGKTFPTLSSGDNNKYPRYDNATNAFIMDTPAGAGSALTIEEVDASPTDSAPTKLVFPNGTLGLVGHVMTYTPTGGGGSTISSGVLASRPSPGTAGNLYLATDTGVIYEDTGSVWQPFGPMKRMKEPDDSLYAWVNQSTGSVSTANGGIILSVPGGGASGPRIRKFAAPATPYTVTLAFRPLFWFVDSFEAGFCARVSSGGNTGYTLRHGIKYSTSTPAAPVLISGDIQDATFANWTTYTTTPTNGSVLSSIMFAGNGLIWLRYTDDGTNRKQFISPDGIKWFQLLSQGRTTDRTFDEVGFFCKNAHATLDAYFHLYHWEVT